MATRRLLSYVFQERQLLRIAQNALRNNEFAQCAELGFQRFDPWFLQRPGVVMPAQSHACPLLLHGDIWREELKNLNNATRNHLPMEVASPPEAKIFAEETRLLRFVQIDEVRESLCQIPRPCITRKELLRICMDYTSEEDAKEVVKSLDEAGQILIVGDRVYLRPEEVTKAIERIVPLLDDLHKEELQEMEKQKAEIDLEAEKLVYREQWCGFGLLILQTAALVRLVYWELSWDLIEPISFYITSFYFSAGYAFFVKTWTDPTFQGFFRARFKARQKRLMQKRNFDMERFEELSKKAGPRLR